MEWKLAEAKNRFSEVVRLALSEGPQRVVRRNDSVVVLAEADYERLTGSQPTFKEFLMRAGPDLEGLDLSRDRSPMRDFEL
jgi:antitoxin Phd